MSDVKQTIQVTNAGLSPILSIAQGTGMVDFEFTISDFQIPAGSTAVAWNIQPTGNIVSQVCTLVGNVITATPPAYYFLRGKNYMQIQVTGADGVNLFTFLIEVWCSPNISAPVVSQNPDLITQLMAMIGNTQDLDTAAKNNLVAAINEIYGRGVVDILDTEEEIEANTDTGKATGALVTKQLISEIDERFPDDVRIFAEGSGEDVEYYAQLGADAASKKLLGDSSQILAIFHASTSSAVRYTADRKITGITMISEDVRTSIVQLRINNEPQTGVNIAQIDGGEFGCRVYDVTLNVGDEVAVISSGGGGADMVLLSGMVDAAQVTS